MNECYWYEKPVNIPYPPDFVCATNCKYISFDDEPEPKVIDRYRLTEMGVMTRIEFRNKYNC